MDNNTEKHNENADNITEHGFVRETIIDKKSSFKRGLFKAIANFVLILVVCVVTCTIFIKMANISKNKEDESTPDTTMLNQQNTTTEVETTTEGKEITTDKELTEKEKTERRIQGSIVMLTGYYEELPEKFEGVVLSKSDEVIILTGSANIKSPEAVYAKIGEHEDIPVELILKDNELGIAFLKINKKNIDKETLEKIVVPSISKNADIEIGNTAKYYGWIDGVGMSLLEAKILSQGVVENGIDITYSKYLIDVGVSGAVDGYLFDNSGNLLAVSVRTENAEGKISVIDLTGFRDEIYSVVTKGYATGLGITGQKVTLEIEKLVGTELPEGMYVTDVVMDSPAYKAGIMVGDIIYEINVTQIESLNDVRAFLDKRNKEDVVSVHLYRNMGTRYNTYTLAVELGERK
ncbi:MAG: PDZ domain-containing protein [Lachnospiraceae bacterium]|nr:PDZ domain-containing protein [Lachnospiraceae bacterium]